MLLQIQQYFANNTSAYFLALGQHIFISLISLGIATLIGVPLGVLCTRLNKQKKWVVLFFQTLRIIPSLAILVLLVPLIGTGIVPAIIALVFLAIPPILMNTLSGLEEVPTFMTETGTSLGMTNTQCWKKVRLPLAYPMILAGIKIALIEIIASATIAAKIGAGGLGGIIFTGLGLARTDLVLIGGLSVAALSLFASLCMSLLDRIILPHQHKRK